MLELIQEVWDVIGGCSDPKASCLVSSQVMFVGIEALLSFSCSSNYISYLKKKTFCHQVSSVTSGFQAAVDLLSPLALFQFSAVTRGKESPSEKSKC